MPLHVPSALLLATALHESDCARNCAVPHHVESYRPQAEALLGAVLGAPSTVLGALEALHRDYVAQAEAHREAEAQEYVWRAKGVADARGLLVTLYSAQGGMRGLEAGLGGLGDPGGLAGPENGADEPED